jgi:hypothetical protein
VGLSESYLSSVDACGCEDVDFGESHFLRPFGALVISPPYPRLTPRALFLRRFAAVFLYRLALYSSRPVAFEQSIYFFRCRAAEIALLGVFQATRGYRKLKRFIVGW